ncbi:MAG TPA: hypothetical protein VNS09_14730 [Solirubrobacter sp.]|nr:hypothetical protein [Solirubrobacter sp.]
MSDLYALPLEQFVPARDALARQLRKAGDREAAARVAKLTKPTPAAWTANQLAREHPELISALLEAGAALREAQDAALAGGGAAGLRAASSAERTAVDAVLAAASGYRPAGRPLSSALADRLRTTLHAAATDESIRSALVDGRLVSEPSAGGAWPFALEDDARGGDAGKAGGRGGDAGKAGGRRGDAGEAGKRGGDAGKAGGRGAARSKIGRGEARTAAHTADTRAAEAHAEGVRAEGARAAEQRAAEERAAEERAAEERAAEVRAALEHELREARGSLRVRERVLAGAREEAEQAAVAAERARQALEAARRAADDAAAEREAAERLVAEADGAVAEARDAVARLEERLD